VICCLRAAVCALLPVLWCQCSAACGLLACSAACGVLPLLCCRVLCFLCSASCALVLLLCCPVLCRFPCVFRLAAFALPSLPCRLRCAAVAVVARFAVFCCPCMWLHVLLVLRCLQARARPSCALASAFVFSCCLCVFCLCSAVFCRLCSAGVALPPARCCLFCALLPWLGRCRFARCGAFCCCCLCSSVRAVLPALCCLLSCCQRFPMFCALRGFVLASFPPILVVAITSLSLPSSFVVIPAASLSSLLPRCCRRCVVVVVAPSLPFVVLVFLSLSVVCALLLVLAVLLCRVCAVPRSLSVVLCCLRPVSFFAAFALFRVLCRLCSEACALL